MGRPERPGQSDGAVDSQTKEEGPDPCGSDHGGQGPPTCQKSLDARCSLRAMLRLLLSFITAPLGNTINIHTSISVCVVKLPFVHFSTSTLRGARTARPVLRHALNLAGAASSCLSSANPPSSSPNPPRSRAYSST